MNPIPYQELDDNIFNPANADGTPSGDWKEILDVNSPCEAHFSADGQQEASLTGLIRYNKMRSATRWFLGFASVTQNSIVGGTTTAFTGGGQLSRENPCPHPQFAQLRASGVSFKPYVPEAANVAEPGFPEDYVFNLDADTPSSLLTVYNPIPGGGSGKKFLQYGSYRNAVAVVKFGAFRFQFLEDNEISLLQQLEFIDQGKPIYSGCGAFEWRRNVWVDTVPRLDMLSADGVSQLAFAEGSPFIPGPPFVPAGPIGPYSTPAANPTAFPAPLGIPTAKCDFTVNWYNVPYNYLSDQSATVSVLYPANILNCIGTVNSSTFMETFTTGTVLLKGAAFETKIFPVPAADGTPMLSVDVKLMFDWFDPENGNPDSLHSGWNLMPYRVNGLWYYAVRTNPVFTVPILGEIGGALNGVPFLQTFDHNTCFDNPNYAPNV